MIISSWFKGMNTAKSDIDELIKKLGSKLQDVLKVTESFLEDCVPYFEYCMRKLKCLGIIIRDILCIMPDEINIGDVPYCILTRSKNKHSLVIRMFHGGILKISKRKNGKLIYVIFKQTEDTIEECIYSRHLRCLETGKTTLQDFLFLLFITYVLSKTHQGLLKDVFRKYNIGCILNAISSCLYKDILAKDIDFARWAMKKYSLTVGSDEFYEFMKKFRKYMSKFSTKSYKETFILDLRNYFRRQGFIEIIAYCRKGEELTDTVMNLYNQKGANFTELFLTTIYSLTGTFVFWSTLLGNIDACLNVAQGKARVL